jgi:hypothetical protein
LIVTTEQLAELVDARRCRSTGAAIICGRRRPAARLFLHGGDAPDSSRRA